MAAVAVPEPHHRGSTTSPHADLVVDCVADLTVALLEHLVDRAAEPGSPVA